MLSANRMSILRKTNWCLHEEDQRHIVNSNCLNILAQRENNSLTSIDCKLDWSRRCGVILTISLNSRRTKTRHLVLHIWLFLGALVWAKGTREDATELAMKDDACGVNTTSTSGLTKPIPSPSLALQIPSRWPKEALHRLST